VGVLCSRPAHQCMRAASNPVPRLRPSHRETRGLLPGLTRRECGAPGSLRGRTPLSRAKSGRRLQFDGGDRLAYQICLPAGGHRPNRHGSDLRPSERCTRGNPCGLLNSDIVAFNLRRRSVPLGAEVVRGPRPAMPGSLGCKYRLWTRHSICRLTAYLLDLAHARPYSGQSSGPMLGPMRARSRLLGSGSTPPYSGFTPVPNRRRP
jgi:hypothetical protein